jgi:hypothetical protein
MLIEGLVTPLVTSGNRRFFLHDVQLKLSLNHPVGAFLSLYCHRRSQSFRIGMKQSMRLDIILSHHNKGYKNHLADIRVLGHILGIKILN